MAVVPNDIEARDRVLSSCRYRGLLVGNTPRQARILLFYRNELQDYLIAALRKADGPLTSRQLACLVCQCEGKDHRDRRLLTDVPRRVGCALRKMRAGWVVEVERTAAGQVWRVAELPA